MGKKKSTLKEKNAPKEKKTLSVVVSETNKRKSDNEEGLGFNISNAESVIRPTPRISNTSNKMESSSSNGEGEKSDDESIVIICDALISLFCVFFCLSTSLEMVYTMILKLLDVNLSVNFEIIL